jgi:hypothetical protein
MVFSQSKGDPDPFFRACSKPYAPAITATFQKSLKCNRLADFARAGPFYGKPGSAPKSAVGQFAVPGDAGHSALFIKLRDLDLIDSHFGIIISQVAYSCFPSAPMAQI